MVVQPIRARRNGLPNTTAGPDAPTGVVVDFRPARTAANRFTWRDRIDLLAWAETARALGICRVALERPEPEMGEFALLYDGPAEWARWAVARDGGAYLLWSPNSGETVGSFPSLAAALAGIRDVAA